MKRTRNALLTVALGALLPVFTLHAQEAPLDLEQEYKRVQGIYTTQVNQFEESYASEKQELLKNFIVSLVRVEQTYKDEGNLDGVVLTRQLREAMLLEPQIPENLENDPAALREMKDTLRANVKEAKAAAQKELDTLNVKFAQVLEPYQREFTRQGKFDTAIEIRDLRKFLMGNEQASQSSQSQNTGSQLVVSRDPNAVPFLMEAPDFQKVPGITQRKPMVLLKPQAGDHTVIQQNGFSLRRGQMRIAPEFQKPLLQKVKQNQMLNIEFGFFTGASWQGGDANYAPLFVFGKDVDSCNMAIIQRKRQLYLYLRTTTPPSGRPFHIVPLGGVAADRAQHVQVIYRSGELTVYRNGELRETIRGKINGLMNNWTEQPVVLGFLPNTEDPALNHIWRGNLHFFSIQASLDSARGASANFNRYAAYMSR